jgi:hypothetical protein
MAKSIAVPLDEFTERYVEQAGRRRQTSRSEVGGELIRAAYEDIVRRLHNQYLHGEITFRQMARQLGLEYRELYALLERMNLPIA